MQRTSDVLIGVPSVGPDSGLVLMFPFLTMMTIEKIADYCEIMDCRVSVGGPETGFVHIDGRGIRHSGNYRRFQAFHELGAAPCASAAIRGATVYQLHLPDQERTLTPQEFEDEQRRIQALANG